MQDSPITTKSSFSQRRPLLFGLMLAMAATTILVMGVAAFRVAFGDQDTELDTSDDKIGIVRVTGVIAASEPVTDWITKLRDTPSVRGVLVRVNCPGGAVAPSQEIYDALLKLADAKPVVVSMGTVAASGGYYVSAPAHQIFANPSTLTGSIGVIMELSNLEGLFDKLGIERQALTSGPLKDAGSPFRAMTEKDREYLMGIIADIHEQFVSDVAAARGLETEALRPIADGRALTGNQALEAGLVDKLGGFEDALAELKTLCALEGDVPTVEQPKKKAPLLQQILGHIDITIRTDAAPAGTISVR